MTSILKHTIMCSVILCVTFVASAQAATPSLSIIQPRGVQRGVESDITFNGGRLEDAQEILFYEPGIAVVKLEAGNGGVVKVRIKVDADARLGSYNVRVRTATGISEARTFSVGQYPVAIEKEPNNEFSAPQTIAMNTTVHGVADNEDVDYYIVPAKKGERITAEVEGMRLGSTLFDPYVAIMDMKRFELSASDDNALLLQDPVASIIAPEDGTYVIQVRESSYAGNGGCVYRLHVGNAPRPMVAYPAGGKAGEETEIKFLGDVTGDIVQKIKLPAITARLDGSSDFAYFTVQNGQSAPSPNTLRVSQYGNVLEAEPNNDVATATKYDAELPIAFNGIIEKNGDVDFFRFKAKAGQQFHVNAIGRGIRSPLDPVLSIHNAQGAAIASNDDSGGPDSYIRWGVPADGEYLVAIRDHLDKGGKHHVYRIEFNPVVATVALGIPEYDRNSQNRNAIPIPKGNRYATLIRVGRNNFGGDVVYSAPELPQGVTMFADTAAGNVNEIPVVFEAAADAPIAGKLMHLIGTHATDKNITGGFNQVIELIYGPPNNTIYYKATLDRVATSVCDEAPFKVQMIEPKVLLVQSGQMNIKVVATRKAGFTKPISLRMLWNPPGIGSQGEIVIPEGQTEAYYPINANGGAPARAWKIAITASSDEGKGPVWTSTQLGTLTVAPPFVGMTIDMVAGEQGKTAQILCKFAQSVPFEGKATVTLYGLPPKVTMATASKEITKDDTSIVFDAIVPADAPVGQHKTLFAQIIVTKDGEPIAHNVAGGSVFRIDPPPPPPKVPVAPPPVAVAAPTPMPAPAAPPAAAPPPKVLTRLEKLRLEAEERAKQQK